MALHRRRIDSNSGLIRAQAFATGGTTAVASAGGIAVAAGTFVGTISNVPLSRSPHLRVPPRRRPTVIRVTGHDTGLAPAPLATINIEDSTIWAGVFNDGDLSSSAARRSMSRCVPIRSSSISTAGRHLRQHPSVGRRYRECQRPGVLRRRHQSGHRAGPPLSVCSMSTPAQRSPSPTTPWPWPGSSQCRCSSIRLPDGAVVFEARDG